MLVDQDAHGLPEICPSRRSIIVCRLLHFVCGFLIAVALQAQPAFCQGYGRISGVITDPSNAAVPKAKVTATQGSTGVSTTTTSGADGTFVFPALPPASYDISAASPGFGTYTENNVLLHADASVTVNIALKVGQTNESVVVEAHSAGVDTSSSTLSQVVDTERINDLPLNGRNAASLTTLVAGVVVSPAAQADQGGTKTFPVVVTVTANGTRTGQTSYMLDGGNNVDEYTNVNAPFPFPDALEEFSVQTSNYSAEYGQNAGGVVNIVSKSGTNNYHGDVFEYLRNAYFNAPNWFSPGKAVDPLKRNQFGGTIGGPFKLPGVSTPHSYFFAGYQRTIVRDNALTSTAAVVPTQAQINGTFNGCLTNPFTGAGYPCPNGVTTIDPQTYDPASVALLKYLPKGDPSSGDFFFNKPVRQHFDEFVGRFDHEIGSKDRLTARYYYDRFHSGGVLDLTDLLTYADQANIGYSNFLVSETHMFSERLLNNFVVNYQRDDATRGPLSGGISVANLGVHIWQPALPQINQIQVTNFFTLGDNPQGDFHRFNYTLGDDLHMVRGAHSLSFGVHAELSHIDINNLFRQPGIFTFGAVSGNGIADFLLGYLNAFGQASGQFFNNRGHFYGLYGQDSWKVTRRLTLNYGLRWEPFIPWNEVENRMGEFSPAAYYAGEHSRLYPNAPAGLLFDGDPGMIREGIRHAWGDFMARLGFAWDIFGRGKTSLRGGAGTFYDTRLSGVFNNIFSQGSPFVTQVSVSQLVAKPSAAAATFSNPYNGITNPFPAPQPPPPTSPFPVQNYLTFDPYHQFSVPEFFAWNLALEHEITSSSLVRIAYVGSAGEHLWVPLELNPTFYASGASSAPVYAPTYTQPITEANYGANTNYHSLQVSFERRMNHGVSILGNYTWSKALDDLPLNASVTAIASGNSYVMPYYEANFRRLDYGPSDFDHRNIVALSYVWDLPKLRGGGPLAYVLNGWEADGIFQFRSGDPLTVISGSNNISHTGQARDRAVQLGNPYGGDACAGVKTPCKSFLNPASFTVPTAGTFGEVVKGSFVGPQYADWDVSVMRRFDISERWKANFRADFFNVLNHPNFGDPAAAVPLPPAPGANGKPTSSFGRITGTGSSNGNGSAVYDPRIGQLSLQISF